MFLDLLLQKDELDLCVISDRHISIANAFSHIYGRVYYRLCMRYLTENICVNQHYGEYLYLLYATTKAYTIDELSEHFAQLNNNYPKAAHVLENVFGFEKWSRAHFLGNRYDGMTTNIDESLNSVLMDERKYPLSHIFNSIARKLSEKFRERHTFVDAKNNKFMPYAERILRDNKSGSDSLYVTNANGGLDQFTVFSNGVTAKINLLKRSCSCRKFDLVKMSCEHVMAALREKYGDDVGYRNTIYEYSSLIYKSETYLLMYSKVINIVPSETEWTVPQEVQDTKISPPPRIPNSKGRKSNTLRASMRYSSPNRNRYSICKKFGHKRTTCIMANQS